MKIISERIKELRKEKGLSQTALALKIDKTQDTISLWELGKSYPDAESLILLAKLFQVSVDYILGVEDQFLNN